MPSMSPYVHECDLLVPSIEYASSIAPQEYRLAWEWFMAQEGQWIPALPMGKLHHPEGLPTRIASQRGIHTPNGKDLKNGWRNGRKYALSIHTSIGGKTYYEDKNVIGRPDGTWLLEYAEQRTEDGKEHQWDHNLPLLNCLEDGVPVGVLVAQKPRGYRVYGLAYVERYDERTGFFTLHGPVNALTNGKHMFDSPFVDWVPGPERARLRELLRSRHGGGDERARSVSQLARREQQRQFRQSVFAAYSGRCAATGNGLEEILQAAHIDDFRGSRIQAVQNGILLRVDIRMLYDANLLGIEPESHRIVLSEAADLSQYERLSDRVLNTPKDPSMRPSDELLEIHYKRFLAQQPDGGPSQSARTASKGDRTAKRTLH